MANRIYDRENFNNKTRLVSKPAERQTQSNKGTSRERFNNKSYPSNNQNPYKHQTAIANTSTEAKPQEKESTRGESFLETGKAVPKKDEES